ncbi:uncharacterized protein [Haliotis asinina]|uniref:uncharacterized protein isoform X2 n=1 Tax=Haliotis asinina TaxID=109174 RepID=UPI00353224CD
MSDVCTPHLLFVVLTAASVTAGTEIEHQEVHDGMSKYTFVNGTLRNCVPILAPEYCDEGHQIQPCFHDGERDRCVPCSDGLDQLDKTYSDFPSPCYIISCPEGTVRGERDPSSGCNWPCRCKSERMVMNKHCSCQRVEVKCGGNTYLKNGVCLPCPIGTHKPENSTGPCVSKISPVSHPSGTVTAAVSPASSTSETNTTSALQRNVTQNITGKNMTNDDIDAEEKPPNHRSTNTQITSILAITIATLVLLVGSSTAIIYKIWKRKSPRHSSPEPNDSNESLVRPQEVEGYARVPVIEDPPPYPSDEVHVEDEEIQGMAQPWTKDFGDQATGGQADRVPLDQERVEVIVHEQDTDETGRKEYYKSGQTPSVDQCDPNTETLRKSNRYLDALRGSFPTLESTEQPSSIDSVTCRDPDDTSIKKMQKASSNKENMEALGENMETKYLLCLESTPPLNTDSFKSELEK